MAHKTLVGGTAYGISGGTTLVSGTSYSVKNGKALVNGTTYDISFLIPAKILDLWSTTGYSTFAEISCIAYANGYWVVGGTTGNSSPYSARIAYATNLNGPWTIKDIWSGSYSCYIYCITYANGYWVVGGEYDRTAHIAHAVELNGSWINEMIVANTSTHVSCITYANNYWVCGVSRASSGYVTVV